MKALYIFNILFLFCSCVETKQESKMENQIFDFLNRKEYTYSVSKVDIPSIVIDSISSKDKIPFKIGDNTDIGKISL